MDAGKHVVTDKIMAMNTDEADAMIAASERNNVLLSVFHNRRWDWDYNTVKKIIDDGLLGTPYLYQVAIMRYGPPRGWRGVKRPERWYPLRLARTLCRSGTATRNCTC